MNADSKRVIPAQNVRRLAHPVMVDCPSPGENGKTSQLTVVPLVEGNRVAGLEIRCSCGAAAVVECVYEPEEGS